MQKVMSIMSQAGTVKISRGSTDRHLRLLVINRTNSSADSSANSTSITSSTSGSISSTPGNHIVRLNYRDYRDDRDGWDSQSWNILWLFLSRMRTCFRWDDYRCMGRLAT